MNNYLLHHKKKNADLFTKTFIVVLFVIGILVVVHIFSSNILSGVASFVSEPLWKIKNSAAESFVNSAQLLRSKKSLVAENIMLKDKIQEAKFESISRKLLKDENSSLKELFGRQVHDAESTVLGAVLARPSVSMYDTFVIDVGRDAGISKGENVLVFGDIFIGIVDEVYRNTSVVKLFSSPGELTAVSIGQENISTNAEGTGGGNFIAKLPRGSGIEKGDIVTMPDISIKVFAVVEEIESNPSDPFLIALFKNPVNMNEVKWVQIVIDN